MEKYAVTKFIQTKLNIPITPENVYTSIGNHNSSADAYTNTDAKNVKYLDELYSTAFVDDYFS